MGVGGLGALLYSLASRGGKRANKAPGGIGDGILLFCPPGFCDVGGLLAFAGAIMTHILYFDKNLFLFPKTVVLVPQEGFRGTLGSICVMARPFPP